MGEINRAQELRVDEISFQKFRENHETIQQITSQLQQMQEQMNFINDSDVKSELWCLTVPINLWWRKSETRKKGSMKQGMRAEKFILRHWSISVILRIRSWNLNIRKKKKGSYSEVTLWKMIPGLMQYSPSEDHQHLKWRPQKSWMSLWRTSSWRNIGVHPGENGGCSKTTQNSKIRMSICVDTSSKTWMAQILVEHWRSRVRAHRWPCTLQFFGSSTDQASTFFCSRWQFLRNFSRLEFPVFFGRAQKVMGIHWRFWTCTTWNCQKLKTMVKRSKNQRLRFRNFDAGHGTIESGAVVQSRKGLIGVEGGKGICYQWKEKSQCSKGDRWSFRHETQYRAQKTEYTAGSQPYHEVEVCRGREVSEAKVTMGHARTPCEYWHPPSANSLKKETSCKAGDKCRFPQYKLMNNQIKSQKQSHFIGLCITRFRCGETRCRKSWNQFKGYERSPYGVNFEDRSHEESERQQRWARSKVWNLRNIFTSSKKKTRLHSTFARKNGCSGCVNKRARKKMVCSWFKREYSHGQQDRPDLNSV